MKLFKCAFLGIVAILLCGCGESGGEFDAINVGKVNVAYENGILKIAESRGNSASRSDFLGSASARFVNEPTSSISSLASHNPKNSSTILEFASCKNAESTLDSADSQNLGEKPCHSERSEESKKNNLVILSEAKYLKNQNLDSSLRLRSAQNDKIKKSQNGNFGEKVAESALDSADSQNLQGGLPRRFCESARNDEILDSSPTAQDDKNSTRVAESNLDSAIPKHEANSSIADEFLGLCEASDDDRTLSPSRKRADALPEKSLRDAEFADSSPQDFILFFFTSTCGVCKAQLPILEQLSAQGIKIYAILGDVPDISKASAFVRAHKISLPLFYESGARRFFTSAVGGVKGVPVMVIFKDGKIKEKFIGLTPKGTLLRAI